MSLRTTIHAIQTRDSELSAIATDREDFLNSWRSEVKELYAEITKMLDDLVKEGSIQFRQSTKTIKEAELGEYEITELVVVVANRTIVASPVARLVSGGTGRVDLFRRDRPSDNDRIRLLRRLQLSSESEWFIEEKIADNNSALDKIIQSTSLAALTLAGRSERKYSRLVKSRLEVGLDILLQQ